MSASSLSLLACDYWYFVLLPPTKEEVNAFCPRLSVYLSVCLLARLLKTRAWIWMKMLRVDRCTVQLWTNRLTFEPDLDCSLDAGTGLLSPISYALQHGILLRRENPT